MEYAVRLLNPTPLPEDPRLLCSGEWRELLPDGRLKAIYFGSDFCQDLLPDANEVKRFCALADKAGLEAVLLTPVVRADGLRRLETLFTELDNRNLTPTIVCNDLGVLRILHSQYPHYRRQAGRLLNRALRDPRLADQPREPQNPDSTRGAQIHTLLRRFGASGLETDPDLEGSYLGDGTSGLRRVLHLPYVFAASGRNCLYKAAAQGDGHNFASWLNQSCPAPCRERWEQEIREDLDFPLFRAGNTLFYEASRSAFETHLQRTDRIVVHPRPTP